MLLHLAPSIDESACFQHLWQVLQVKIPGSPGGLACPGADGQRKDPTVWRAAQINSGFNGCKGRILSPKTAIEYFVPKNSWNLSFASVHVSKLMKSVFHQLWWFLVRCHICPTTQYTEPDWRAFTSTVPGCRIHTPSQRAPSGHTPPGQTSDTSPPGSSQAPNLPSI
jgi:hypothetical protein